MGRGCHSTMEMHNRERKCVHVRIAAHEGRIGTVGQHSSFSHKSCDESGENNKGLKRVSLPVQTLTVARIPQWFTNRRLPPHRQRPYCASCIAIQFETGINNIL